MGSLVRTQYRAPFIVSGLCITDVIESALALYLTDRSYVASKLTESLEKEELTPEALQEYDQRVASWKSGETRSSTSNEREQKTDEASSAV